MVSIFFYIKNTSFSLYLFESNPVDFLLSKRKGQKYFFPHWFHQNLFHCFLLGPQILQLLKTLAFMWNEVKSRHVTPYVTYVPLFGLEKSFFSSQVSCLCPTDSECCCVYLFSRDFSWTQLLKCTCDVSFLISSKVKFESRAILCESV